MTRAANLVMFRDHVRATHRCCASSPLWAVQQALEEHPDDWGMANERLCGINRETSDAQPEPQALCIGCEHLVPETAMAWSEDHRYLCCECRGDHRTHASAYRDWGSNDLI